MSLKAALDEKIRQIKAGEITTGIENGVSRVARVVAGKLLLEPNYGVSSRDKQITVSRRDVGRFTWE